MSSNPETVSETVPETTSTESADTTVEEVAVEATETEEESSSPISLSAMPLDAAQIKHIVEAALMAAGQPCSLDRLLSLFLDAHQPSREELRAALAELAEDCASRGVELVEVGSGFRFQAKQDYAQWVARLWEEKPARYSRALLETLALIAYRQPITRGEIEDIRGVSVSSNIMKTLIERDWVKVVGHRDVPGKPAMYASTKQFLDYFSLKSLSDLPSLAEIRDIDSINAELDLTEPGSEHAEGGARTDTDMSDTEDLLQDEQVATGSENIAEEESAESAEQSSADAAEQMAATDDAMMEDEASAGDELLAEQVEGEIMSSDEETVELSDAAQNAVSTADPA